MITVAGGLLAASAVAGSAVLAADGARSPVDAAAPAGALADDQVGGSLADDRLGAAPTGDRTEARASRGGSMARPSLASLKARALADQSETDEHARGTVATGEVAVADTDPQQLALTMLPEYGWSASEHPCLVDLWTRESGWDPYADNPTSSAYGIPQSLPGEKMAAAGPDWATNPATQIEWGLGYIAEVYGSPCAANAFQLANNWY